MNPVELVRAVEAVGGVLSIQEQRLHCEVPDQAAHLLPELREQRHAVAQLLQQRLGDSVQRWIAAECVSVSQVAGNSKILHREFVSWSGMQCSPEAFVAELERCGFAMLGGMVDGLGLTSDLLALLEYERGRRV